MTITEATETIDEFVGRFATDLGAVLHATTVVVGDKLGLYKALARLGPSTAAEPVATGQPTFRLRGGAGQESR